MKPYLAEIDRLVPHVPVTGRSDFRDLISDGQVIAASPLSFTVITETGDELKVFPPGGLTERVYQGLAPWIDDDENAIVAPIVLKCRLGWPDDDWQLVLRRIEQACGSQPEPRLTAWIDSVGFAAAAEGFHVILNEERLRYPRRVEPPNLPLEPLDRPRWEGRTLTFGDFTASPKLGCGTLSAVFNALESTAWKPVDGTPWAESAGVDHSKMRSAVNKFLRKRHAPFRIRVATDCRISWIRLDNKKAGRK